MDAKHYVDESRCLLASEASFTKTVTVCRCGRLAILDQTERRDMLPCARLMFQVLVILVMAHLGGFFTDVCTAIGTPMCKRLIERAKMQSDSDRDRRPFGAVRRIYGPFKTNVGRKKRCFQT